MQGEQDQRVKGRGQVLQGACWLPSGVWHHWEWIRVHASVKDMGVSVWHVGCLCCECAQCGGPPGPSDSSSLGATVPAPSGASGSFLWVCSHPKPVPLAPPAPVQIRPSEGGRTPQLDRGTHRPLYRPRLPEGSEGWDYPVHVSVGVGSCSSLRGLHVENTRPCRVRRACFFLSESWVLLFFFLCYCFVEGC